MLRDLGASDGQALTLDADVLVIGAGIAGLLAATRLSRAGHRVVVLESGAETQDGEVHPLNAVEQRGDIYAGAASGRFRCLGGTSTRWGGAMLPFRPSDFTLRPAGWDAAWPAGFQAVTRYQGDVERLFGLGDAAYDIPAVMSGGFTARLAKWPPFRLRNVATTLDAEIRAGHGPEIWLNATATDFVIGPAGRLDSVQARSASGRSMRVTARQVIIAAGALESTRLLLLADRQHDNRIFAPDAVLGRYFYDHLSVVAAKLVDVVPHALNRLIGLRFEAAIMRTIRFEPNADLRVAAALPAGFVHIVAATQRPGSLAALRQVMLKLQQRRSPAPTDIAALARASPWRARALWWRYWEKRLLFPDAAEFQVHIVTEQEPLADNRIGLSDRLDPFGSPLAAIDWTVRDSDAANTLATAKAFMAAWNAADVSRLGRVEMNVPQDLRRALADGGGIYHPGGSVRMGDGPRGAVVDADLATFRIPNLSVVSTATFPLGGGANPTMMLMMAALRVADRLGPLLGQPNAR